MMTPDHVSTCSIPLLPSITPVINHIKHHAGLDPASGLIPDSRFRGMRALTCIVAGVKGTIIMSTVSCFCKPSRQPAAGLIEDEVSCKNYCCQLSAVSKNHKNRSCFSHGDNVIPESVSADVRNPVFAFLFFAVSFPLIHQSLLH